MNRPCGVAARIGGEFAVLLSNHDLAAAMGGAESLCAQVQQSHISDR